MLIIKLVVYFTMVHAQQHGQLSEFCLRILSQALNIHTLNTSQHTMPPVTQFLVPSLHIFNKTFIIKHVYMTAEKNIFKMYGLCV